MLLGFEKIKSVFLKVIFVTLIVYASKFGDWGITAPLWVLGFYSFRNDKKKMLIYYLSVTAFWFVRATLSCIDKGFVWYGEYCQLGLLLFPFMLFSYNGEKGSEGRFSKWFFYVFYPLHLFVLTIIKNLME